MFLHIDIKTPKVLKSWWIPRHLTITESYTNLSGNVRLVHVQESCHEQYDGSNNDDLKDQHSQLKQVEPDKQNDVKMLRPIYFQIKIGY